jgi:hypothetical protein
MQCKNANVMRISKKKIASLFSVKKRGEKSSIDRSFASHYQPWCALVKNINTKAGLTNETVGTINSVCYDTKEVHAVLDRKHPQPYDVIMDFRILSALVTKRK